MTDFYNSWYYASRNWQGNFPALEHDIDVDVCIIGGGITGLSTAIALREKGYSVALLESHEIGFGASGRSGGQIIFGLACDQEKLERLIGFEQAHRVWQLSLEGLDLVKSNIKKYNIDCDYQPGHVHAAIKPRHTKELMQWKNHLEQRYGYSSLEYWPKALMQTQVCSERYRGGLFDSNSGHLHPLNYTLGLAKAAAELGVQIYQHTAAITVNKVGASTRIRTPHAEVTSQSCVLAGNAYLDLPNLTNTRKIMPVTTYIAATEPLGQILANRLIPNNIAVADVNFVLDYFRLSEDHRLLFGGKVSYSAQTPKKLAAVMKRSITKVFPELANTAIDYSWGGNVAITLNRAPSLGKLNNNLFYSQGYSGHGMALAGISGQVLANAIDNNCLNFNLLNEIPHTQFPGGKWFRMPALVLATSWYRLKDRLS